MDTSSFESLLETMREADVSAESAAVAWTSEQLGDKRRVACSSRLHELDTIGRIRRAHRALPAVVHRATAHVRTRLVRSRMDVVRATARQAQSDGQLGAVAQPEKTRIHAGSEVALSRASTLPGLAQPADEARHFVDGEAGGVCGTYENWRHVDLNQAAVDNQEPTNRPKARPLRERPSRGTLPSSAERATSHKAPPTSATAKPTADHSLSKRKLGKGVPCAQG